MTQWFFHYKQTHEGNGVWQLGLANQRERIVKDKRPAFTTILDTDNSFESELTADELAKVHYRGPFYIDLDSEDAEKVISDFKKLLIMLRDDYRVDLDQVALYATGGRGFHLIFPQQMFMDKVPPRGMIGLPLIYREMAMELIVDTLDMNIYSTKRGRMFREKNLEREKNGEPTGRYKVQITTQEALEMTVELYQQVCSSPRHLKATDQPDYHPDLGLIFSKAQAKVDQGLKRRKNAKADASILASFGGKVPPTLLSIMSGENLEPGQGFQAIATQLAIAAHAMNMSETEFIDACEGLIANHQGDSSRYGSPAKRRAELKRMWAYMAGNPCYTFSVGGIKKMLAKDVRAPDLDMGAIGTEEGNDEAGEDEISFSVSQGVRVTETGIYKKTEEGVVKASALGMSDPRQLLDLQTGEVHGYEVNVLIDGDYKKRAIITMDCFGSRAAFQKFTLSAGSCSINLSDAQIGALADIFRVRTMTTNQQVYTVKREGIDLVTTPRGELDLVWADQFGVTSNYGMNYRLTGSMTEDLQFRTDLRNAPFLEDTPEAREFFKNLFQINRREVVARVFGFMASTYLSQMIRHIFNKFPFLQVYGPAGSGKSETIKLMARMHYYKQEPLTSSALDSTKFVFEEMATCSGSIPFILEEYKPREMDKRLLEKSKGILRSNYNGDTIGKGAVQSSTGQSKLLVTRVSNRSPIVVLGEAIISQTAILDRCVAVAITKEGKKDRREHFQHCQANRHFLSMFGRNCIDMALAVSQDGLRNQVEMHMESVREKVGAKADDNDRPLYNVAVMLTGLEFARRVMKQVFGDTFNEEFQLMKDSVTDAAETLIPKVVSEAAKVLDQMAFLSRYGENESVRLFPGEDYVIDGPAIFIRLRNAFTKYQKFKRSMGEEVLYDSYEAFFSAMSTYPGTVDRICHTSPLKDSPQTAVFQFSVAHLMKDNVEEFKS
jgi:hypothetical protein